MESYIDPAQGAPSAEEMHRGKATTAMVLAIIGLALLILPSFNLGGLVLSIIGLCMAVKNRRFAAANGLTENGNNTAAFICGLIGVIVNGLMTLFILFGVILLLVVGVSLLNVAGPTIGDIFSENAPAIHDAIEGLLPIVESAIPGLFGWL